MPVDMNKLGTARQRWPKRMDTLPASVQAVFAAWEQCGEQECDDALAQIEGFTKPPGRFSVKHKCRDLTLMRSPLPPAAPNVPALTLADVSIFFGTSVPAVSRGTDSESESGRSTSSDDRMTFMESSLAKCFETIAKQNEQLVTQAATLERLFKAQADPEEIQTSTYEVADSVLAKLGRNTAGKMSWLDIKPLPKSERRRILREHGGTFTTFPPDLDMLASTKALKLGLQDAKVTLPNFATQEVAKFMTRNAGTIKMCGTVLSRVREMKADLTLQSAGSGEEDDEMESPDLTQTIPTTMLVEFSSVLESAAEGAMDLSIDTQTLMRLSVSRRIEAALGVAHFHQDPTKHPKEDFMSPKTLSIIEDAAKMREDLTWAMEARKIVTGERAPLFHSRLHKSPGGGRGNPSTQRGQGRDTGGRERTGKGKGGNKAAHRDKGKADADPDSEQ
jgi:hypothetical protein